MADLVDNGTYPIYQWTFCSAAIAATLGRFYIRLGRFKAIKWDDVFNGLALLSLVGLTTANYSAMYKFYSGDAQKAILAQDMLLWTTLYCVKASFLALIRYIFKISKTFLSAWWAITIYTFLTFWPILLSELWHCGSPSNYNNEQACQEASVTRQFLIAPAWFKFILHLSSEICILVLPINQIRKMQMSTGKKIGVAAVFALIVIDIICGIIRNVSFISTKYSSYTDQISVNISYVMGVGEPALAVIVCTLPVYRVLLPSKTSKERSPQQRQSRNRFLVGRRNFAPVESVEGLESSTSEHKETVVV